MSERQEQVKVSEVGPRLTGKTAIITGAGSGMGAATVDRFVAEGANVVGVDLHIEGLDAMAAKHGDRFEARQGDVTDREFIRSVVNGSVERFGDLDIYFNNAGTAFAAKPVEEATDDEWDLAIDVNLRAIYIAAREVVPIMKKNGRGSFIITASMAGVRPRANLNPYTIAKGGAVHMAKALAIELAPDLIRVNAICPVAADTPMLAQFGAGDHITAKATPMGRLVAPEEIAAAATFLASDDSQFITGLAIPVDGGRSI